MQHGTSHSRICYDKSHACTTNTSPDVHATMRSLWNVTKPTQPGGVTWLSPITLNPSCGGGQPFANSGAVIGCATMLKLPPVAAEMLHLPVANDLCSDRGDMPAEQKAGSPKLNTRLHARPLLTGAVRPSTYESAMQALKEIRLKRSSQS